MGRELKRVPMDFDWPQGQVWPGYRMSICRLFSDGEKGCEMCRHFARLNGEVLAGNECPKPTIVEPPKGEGFQLWETTSEGSPASPVFATLEELCEWCEDNATTFAGFKATKEDWKKMLEADFVYHQQGSVVFL